VKSSATVLVLATIAIGCGRADRGPATRPVATTANDTQSLPDIASSDPQLKFFHEQLVDNGEDTQSEFGSDLISLGMNPRDLQQDDPKHAYDTVLEKVQHISDPALKRDMMRTFFNRTDQAR
jgi:hypothetical protein